MKFYQHIFRAATAALFAVAGMLPAQIDGAKTERQSRCVVDSEDGGIDANIRVHGKLGPSAPCKLKVAKDDWRDILPAELHHFDYDKQYFAFYDVTQSKVLVTTTLNHDGKTVFLGGLRTLKAKSQLTAEDYEHLSETLASQPGMDSKPLTSRAEPANKLAQDIDTSNPEALQDVIVQFKDTPRGAQYFRYLSAGVKVKATLHGINAAVFTLPQGMLARLAGDPDVLYVTPDRPVTFNDQEADDLGEVMANAAVIGAPQVAGISVAVIDSGVRAHADLGNRLVYSESFVVGNLSADDQYGHGTHVAGLIAGDGTSSGSANGYPKIYRGLAPGVNVVNLRVLDQTGRGTDSGVVAAIQRAVQLKDQYKIRVINLSLGHSVMESYNLDPLCQAVEQAWRAGIVVVVAAGNNGRDNSFGTMGFSTIDTPGNDPSVITVGATRSGSATADRSYDTVASYSSKGPTLIDHIAKPDLVAPGNRLISLRATGSTLDIAHPEFIVKSSTGVSSYFRLSGTSMATPVVSGAAILLMQRDPNLTPDLIKARLMKTAWKGFSTYTQSYDVYGSAYNNQFDVFTYGAGYLDVQAALANADSGVGVALSPTAVRNAASGVITLEKTVPGATSVVWGSSVIWGSSAIWSNSVVWGNALVSGDLALSGSSVVWGSSVIWGAAVPTSSSVVWGSSVIWGTSVVWGTSTSGALSDGQDGEN